jgi:hypothetical protein
MIFISNEIKIGDGDFFIRKFNSYLDLGHYQSVVNGTSVVYNFALKSLYTFTGNVNLTFLIFNSISLLTIGLIGFFIIKKWYGKKNHVISFFMIYYMLITFNSDEFYDSRNDLFLAVIFMIIYVLIHKVINCKTLKLKVFISIGLLYALAIGTRIFSILFIIPYIIFVVYLLYNFKLKKVALSQVFFILSFLITTILIHYPSIKKNGTISSFDKSEDQNINWIHLNTIATKKMFETKKIELIRKSVYWEMVNREKYYLYLKEHNILESELPNTISEYIRYDFVNYSKLIVLNLINTILYFFRHLGFLFILPFLYFIREVKSKGIHLLRNKNNLFFIMFMLFYLSLISILNTIIEFRWFSSFMILFYISIIISFNYYYKMKPLFTKRIFIGSLVFLIVLNIRTIINLI